MSKKEEFKQFASLHPELIEYIKSKEMTWQKFYEIYDIYGDNKEVWDRYLQKKSDNSIDSISKMVKNIDMESIQKHINTAQKALGLISELTTKNATDIASNIKTPINPRPLNKFFED